LKQKLDSEVEAKSVICLQEVSQNWNGSLHSYFSTKGYHLITAPYGNKFDGYMGVSIAVPLTEYDISNVDITRIADTKRLPRQPRATGFNKAVETFQKIIRSVGRILGTYKDVPELWDSVTHRHNQMISLRLKSRQTDKSFVVGTYHMPCMFKIPSVMMVHCALSAQHLERFAGSDPYVLAGDFNIKPDSNMYRLMTEGTVEASVGFTLS
jgi:2',5'-phosphodiesterase